MASCQSPHLRLLLLSVLLYCRLPCSVQQQPQSAQVLGCRSNWVRGDQSCYRFARSPIKSRSAAAETCESYSADLLSINTVKEHLFIVTWLREHDHLQFSWYVGARRQTSSSWTNEPDGSQLPGAVFHTGPSASTSASDNVYAVYTFEEDRWALQPVDGQDSLSFICETRVSDVRAEHAAQQRSHQFGRGVSSHSDLVPRGPRIIHQPRSVVFDAATRSKLNEVSITCEADGYPYVTYQWQRQSYTNDQLEFVVIDPLSDSRLTVSGGTLLISDPQQRLDRGQYRCMASNQLGSVVSGQAQLSFARLDDFSQDRDDEIGSLWFGKAVKCNAPTVFPDARYQWSRGFFGDFVEDNRRLFVSYDGTLYFSALEHADDARYMCSVRASVSKDGKNGPLFRLIVQQSGSSESLRFALNFPKVFPRAPQEGDNVRLECMAFGYPVPSYNWSRADGGALPASARISSHGRVLTLRNVAVSERGQYVCTTSNGQTQQGSVALAIQAKPRFTISLQDLHADQDSDVSLECEAFGDPDVTYMWLRNGVKIADEMLARNRRMQVLDNRLTIGNVTPPDQAVYQCCALNQLGTACSSAQLRVLHMPPSFGKRPLPTVIIAGRQHNVTLPCQPEAAPAAVVRWTRDDQPVGGSSGRVRVLDSGYLLVQSVADSDQGRYSCVASNQYGRDSSSTALQVLAAPVFTAQPEAKLYRVVGDRVQLQCDARADPSLDLSFVWSHNDLPVDYHHPDSHYRKTDKRGWLEIRDVTLQQAGRYTCEAITTVARVQVSTELVVSGPPYAPGGVRVAGGLATETGTLRWQDFFNNGREISHYTVQARTNWSPHWFTIADNVVLERDTVSSSSWLSDERRLQLRELAPNSRYEFRVAAANPLGRSDFSPASPSYRTQPSRPLVQVAHIRSGGGGMQGDLVIEWQTLSERYQGADGVYYKIFWKRHGLNPESNFKELTLRERGNVGHHVVIVGERYFYTSFKVKVQPFNSLGAGPESDEAVIFSAEGMPSTVPTNVLVRPYNSTALNVSWAGVREGRDTVRGKLHGYRVKYWPSYGDEETESLILLSPSLNTSTLIVGLKPFTIYNVKVMAYNSAGSGQESENADGRTYKLPPRSPPTIVNVTAPSPRSVEVTWRISSPSSDEEPYRGFKVRMWEREQDGSQANDTVVPNNGVLRARVTDLQPGQRYYLRVLAYSLGGDGTMSSPIRDVQMGDPEKLRGQSSGQLEPHQCLVLLTPLAMAVGWLSYHNAL